MVNIQHKLNIPAFVLAASLSFTWIPRNQAGDSLTLENSIVEALEANPELQSYYSRWQASQTIPIQESTLPEPKISYTQFLSKVQTRTGPQERIFQLNQPFPWPGKLALQGGIANREAEMIFHQYEALQREVITRLSNYYFDYALLGEATRITRSNVAYIEKLIPVVDERVRGGGRLADSLLLEIEKEKAIDQVSGLREQRAIISSALEKEMGRIPQISNPLPFPNLHKGYIALPPLSSLEEKLNCHPRIAAAESKILTSELKCELASKSSLPDINLGTSLIDIGNSGETAVGIVLGFNLPIRKNKYNAELDQSKSEHRSATQLRSEAINNLRSSLHREFQILKDAQRRVSLYRDKLIPKTEQTLAQLEEGYRGGKAGIDEIIDVETMLLKLRLECLRATAEANKKAITIRILTEPIKTHSIQALPVKVR